MKSAAGSATNSRPRALRPLAAAALSAAALFGPQAVGFASAAPGPVPAPGTSCADIEVVFARGTFEAPGVGDTGQAFVNALNSRVGGQTVNVHGVNYPASLDFQDAVQGVADAAAEIQSTAASCPNTKIVLGGYSQGAAVAAFTTSDNVPAGVTLPAGLTGPMPPAIADHVAAVVLFGTPDSWFLNLVDHSAPPIAIGRLYATKTLQLCNPGDPVCSPGGLDRAAHSAYKNNGAADQAADFAANALSSAASAQQTDAPV
jgi:cutinase